MEVIAIILYAITEALKSMGAVIIIALGGMALSVFFARRGLPIQQTITVGVVLLYMVWVFLLPLADQVIGWFYVSMANLGGGY